MLIYELRYRLANFLGTTTPNLIIKYPTKLITNFFEGHNMIDRGSRLVQCYIGKYSYCSYDCKLIRIKIGKYCSIGPRVSAGFSTHPTKEWVTTHPSFYMNLYRILGYTIHKDNTCLFNPYRQTSDGYLAEIGNDVWIGVGVKIMDGIKIGDGAIIAAGSVVVKDVSPYTIVGGNPARVIRKRFSDSQIEFLSKIQWWNKSEEWIKKNYRDFNDIELFMVKHRSINL